ncbi:MAG: class I SAM-dependent methyltransferase [Thermodesulfobacteriota bacterium]|jgi:SAM-dependent methyltransferase
MEESKRATARKIANQYLSKGDPLGWFEELYSQAKAEVSIIPWADLMPNPHLLTRLDRHGINGAGKKALKIGCGLGDDAEALVHRGFDTTAFDISPTAIDWCRRRFPKSSAHYLVADLFSAPQDWREAFDFVLESYTLQVLSPGLRRKAVSEIAYFIKPGGTLLVIARGREQSDDEGKMPWPLTKEDLIGFKTSDLQEVNFEDYMDNEDPPVRRFRVVYKKSGSV